MTVRIFNPPDNGVLPDPLTDWTVSAAISPNDDGSVDPLDGMLYDYDTGEGYVSLAAMRVGSDSSGNDLWQIELDHDGDIQAGHSLLVYCYDTFDTTGQNVDTHAETASGAALKKHAKREKSSPPSESPAKIKIDSATLSGTTITVQGELTPNTRGIVLLAFKNAKAGAGNKSTAGQMQVLLPSSGQSWTCTFQHVEVKNWTHIAALALIPGQKGKTKAKPIKIP